MSTRVTREIEKIQRDRLQADFQGKPSNQFVDDVRASMMFQFDGSELSSAAPAALATMGSCLIAAATPMADKVRLEESRPTGGFKYMTNRSHSSLRYCLLEVGQVGGIKAFRTAAANMEGLRIASARIVNERIPSAFQRLGPVAQGPDQTDDFKDELYRLLKDSNQCSALTKEIKDAFTHWGLMCTELQSCCEAQITATTIKRDSTKIDEEMAIVSKQFSVAAKNSAEKEVKRAKDQIDKAQKQFDTTTFKVPELWKSLLQNAVSGWTQTLPHIVAGVVPAVLATSNPTADNTQVQKSTVNDPAYPAATLIRALVSHFSDYLESNSGKPDWPKFTEASKESPTTTGIVYLLGNFTGLKSGLDLTGTESNKRFATALDQLIKVATSMKDHIAKQSETATPQVNDETLYSWKADVKKAKTDVIELATVDSFMSSNNMSNPFTNPKIDLPKIDLSAQTAQMNVAQQGVAIAQAIADLAANSYNKSVERQAKTASVLSNFQQKVKSFQEAGKTLEEIKTVLHNAIPILVDMTVQFGKLEQFTTMLSLVITLLIEPKVNEFNQDMEKAGDRGFRDNIITSDMVAQQTIYMAVSQIKGYFSSLNDIAAMYCEIHRRYISSGIDMCTNLLTKAVRGDSNETELAPLTEYAADSGECVRKLIREQQDQQLNRLRDRARKTAEDATSTMKVILDAGYPAIDDSVKKAIEAGKETGKSEAETILVSAGITST